MKILLVNKYFFRKGGAENLFFGTAELLKKKGHEVHFFSMSHENNYPSNDQDYFVSNIDYSSGSPKKKIIHAARLLYSFEAKERIRRLAVEVRPDIVHLHNIYHQISPSILHALKKLNIPVVMTLHDYKMVCAGYTMLSPRGICEKCRGGRYYYCLWEKCTKNSRLKSLLNVCEMYLHHRIMEIYDLVDLFIAPSRFMMRKMEEMGFKRKMVHLPNFVDVDSFGPRYDWESPTVICFGRLSGEKGLSTLITAVKGIPDIDLAIIGDGPIREELEKRIREEKIGNVRLAGHKTGEVLKGLIASSMFGILPSECYENNPMSLVELFALGKPAVGSRIGGIPDMIGSGERGLLFEPGDTNDLRAKITHLSRHPETIRQMGKNARKYAEEELNPELHYKGLIEVYQGVVGKGPRLQG